MDLVSWLGSEEAYRFVMAKKPNRQDLPFELVYEILANLPVKPLTKFRSVSKRWNSLISDHSFQREQHHRALKRDPVLLIASTGVDDHTGAKTLDFSTLESYGGDDISDFSILFPHPPPVSDSCQSIQSCQGLVCVALSTDVLVCNPATREIIALPAVDSDNCCVGFGYAASVQEFKVVRVFRDHFSNSNENFCEILTLGTGEWRKPRCPHPDSYSNMSFYAPFLHGAVHFLSDSDHHNADDAIYALDIESEEYRTIRFPEYYYSLEEEQALPSWHCLNELRGSLCLTVVLEAGMDLWFLKDYYNGKWEKEYSIGLPELLSDFVWGEPLALMGDGDILLKVFDEGSCGQLYWYNPKDKTFTETIMEDYTATLYVESLLSPAASAARLMSDPMVDAEPYSDPISEVF